MRLAALFSGGKDSTYSIYKTKDEHDIVCLLTISPSTEESELFHYPNIHITSLQSNLMDIPQIIVQSETDTKTQATTLQDTIQQAIELYHIEGIVHGGIASEFQKKHFQSICTKLDISMISPVWNQDQDTYMQSLLDEKFDFIISSVSADGLDDSWLGKTIKSAELENLKQLSKKYGFNLNFEGGEAETLVVNCPLFSSPLQITKTKKIWDGYRGRLEIIEANS